jgi:hypothetical protein
VCLNYFLKIIFILIHYFIFDAFFFNFVFCHKEMYIFVNVIHLIIIHSCPLYFGENNHEEVLINLITLFCKYLILNIFMLRTVIINYKCKYISDSHNEEETMTLN